MDFFLLARYLHFISIFLVVGSMFFEAFFLRDAHKRKEINFLTKVDGLYGLGAIGVVAFGLWMWLGGIGKPIDFYTYNWVFHLKVATFIIIGVLSIFPTVFFNKHKTGDAEEEVKIPRHIRIIVFIEVGLLFTIPLMAVLMARGIGAFVPD